MKPVLKVCISLFVLLALSPLLFAQSGPNRYSSNPAISGDPILTDDINMNFYEIITTNLKFTKEENLQKVVFAPFKLSSSPYHDILSETKFNLAQKNDISTIGIGLGFDNSSPYSKRGHKIFNSISNPTSRTRDFFIIEDTYKPKVIPSVPNPNDANFPDKLREYYSALKYYNDSLNVYNDILKIAQRDTAVYNREVDSLYGYRYSEKLVRNSFKLTLSYNISLFKIIGGSKIKNTDSVVTNYYTIKSNSVGLSGIYNFNSLSGISFGLNYIYKRASAEQDQKAAEYVGASFSYSFTAIKFIRDYLNDPEYKKSLFLPCMRSGVTFELLNCFNNKSFAEDGIVQNYIAIPFLEFKIKPTAQFRAGVPFKIYKSNGKDQLGLGPFIQLTLQLADIN